MIVKIRKSFVQKDVQVEEETIVVKLLGGSQGKAATVDAGTTETLPAGSPATVENVGTLNAAIFDFGIPEGKKGADAVGAPTGEVELGNVDAPSGDTIYKAEPIQNELQSVDSIIVSSFVAASNGSIQSSSVGRDVAKFICSENEIFRTFMLSSSSGTAAVAFYDINDVWLGTYAAGVTGNLESTFITPLTCSYFLSTYINSEEIIAIKISTEFNDAIKGIMADDLNTISILKAKSKVRIINSLWNNMISYDGSTFSIPADLKIVVDGLVEKSSVLQNLTIAAGTQEIFYKYSTSTFVASADGVATYYEDTDYYYVCTISYKGDIIGLNTEHYINKLGVIIGDYRNNMFTYSDSSHVTMTYEKQPTWTKFFRKVNVYTSNPKEVFVLKTITTDTGGVITSTEIQAWVDGLRVGTFIHLFSSFEDLGNNIYYKKFGVVYDSGKIGDAVIEIEIDGNETISAGLGGTNDTGIHVAPKQIQLNTFGNTQSSNLLDYSEAYKRALDSSSVPYLDLYINGTIGIENSAPFVNLDLLHYNAAGYDRLKQITTAFIRDNAGFTDLTGKTLGVFGGSFSVIGDSTPLKQYWETELGLTYTDNGVGGNGFSSLIPAGNIPDQVSAGGVYDIYLLWASTNDLRNESLGVKIGEPNSLDATTASGGLNLAVSRCFLKNPNAYIIFFTPLKTFAEVKYYDPNNAAL